MGFAQAPSGCFSENWPSSVGFVNGIAFNVPIGSGTGWTYRWVVTPNLQIVSGLTSNTAYIKGLTSGYGDVYVVRYKDGVQACSDKKTITIGKPGGLVTSSCKATINRAYCSSGIPGYNATINVDVNATNPFSHLSSVLVQWDPDYFSGSQAAGGLYNINANANSLVPSQFNINAQITSQTGFYVPIIVKYTDLVTNDVCIVKLNPLLTGCSGSPFRQSNIKNEDVLLTPIPYKSGEILNVDFTDKKDINNIEIYSLDGIKIEEFKYSDKNNIILNCKAGIYLMKIYTLDKVLDKKIIVE
jgi:hypothetical protein